VAPDGVSKLVSDGELNATHRASHSKPEPLKPGEVYELKIPMKSMAYIFPAGHRIRVDVASADFQNAWPVSKAAVNAVHRSRAHPSRLILPVAPEQNPKLPAPDLKPSPNPLPAPETVKKPEYTVTYDLINQTVSVRTATGPTGSTTFTVSPKNPADAVLRATQDFVVSKPDMQVKVETQCVTASDATTKKSRLFASHNLHMFAGPPVAQRGVIWRYIPLHGVTSPRKETSGKTRIAHGGIPV
jgi:hypothetical protein